MNKNIDKKLANRKKIAAKLRKRDWTDQLTPMFRGKISKLRAKLSG